MFQWQHYFSESYKNAVGYVQFLKQSTLIYVGTGRSFHFIIEQILLLLCAGYFSKHLAVSKTDKASPIILWSL